MDELMKTMLSLNQPPQQQTRASPWESIANACIDRAFTLFQTLDEQPEKFDEMAGLVRLAMDIDAHYTKNYQEDTHNGEMDNRRNPGGNDLAGRESERELYDQLSQR